jgi:hypothetical protein
MIRALFLLLCLLLLWVSSAHAQSSVTPYPLNGVLTTCSNGTGTPVTAVTTAATTICAAATTQAPVGIDRYYWRVTAVSGTPGTLALLCTDNGTTPSATNFTFPVYASALTDSSAQSVISTAAIRCISNTGSTVTITASAVQTGTP